MIAYKGFAPDFTASFGSGKKQYHVGDVLEEEKISAVKREENLQELREKNNTRVLQGLMEDFMEAV